MAVADRNLLPVSIDGRRYLADMSRYSRATLPWQRQPQDAGREPGLQSLNTYGAWRRTLSDWTLGAGQKEQDRPESSVRRFWRSQGVDVWEDGQATLLPSLARVTSIGTAATMRLAAVGAKLYAFYGSTAVLISDPTGTPTTTSGAVGGTVTSVASGAGYVYAAISTGVQRAAAGSTSFAAWSAVNTSDVWFANGRLIGTADGKTLYELDSAGAKVAPDLKFDVTVQQVFGTPFGIYAVGYEKDGPPSGHVLRIPVETDGSLGTPVSAATFPIGETLLSAQPVANYVMLGTNRGVRLGKFAGDGSINYGPYIDPSRGGGVSVSKMATGGDYVWFGWDAYTAPDGNVYNGLGRLQLSEFTSPLAPGYAHDLSVQTASVLDDVTFTRDSDVPLVALGGDVWAASDSLAASGDVVSGWLRWGVPDNKVPTSVDVRHEPLPAGASVQVFLQEEDGTETLAGTSSVTGAVGATFAVDTTAVGTGEAFRLRVRLTRATDTTKGPTLNRVSLYGLPVPSRTTQIVVPLIVEETVNTGLGSDVPMDPLVEAQALEAMLEARVPVTYEEGGSTFRVVVDGVQLPEDESRGWTRHNGFPAGLIVATLLTVD